MAPYLVCYSSQTGTSKKLAINFAHEIEHTIDHSEIPTTGNLFEVKSINNLEEPKDLVGWKLICFFISTYGDGEQCNDGELFYNKLRQSEDRCFEKYGVQTLFTMFGCGNSLYDEYQGAANDLCEELKRLSFHKVGDFGKGDDGCDMLMEDYNEWKLDTIPLLQNLLDLPLVQKQNEYIPQFDVTETDEKEVSLFDKNSNPPYHEDNPFFAHIMEIKELERSDNDAKKVIHASLNLEQRKTNLHYTTGDYLAIYPSNSETDVRSFLELLGLWDKRNQVAKIVPIGHAIKPFYPIPCSYFSLCKYYLEINASPSRQMIRFIANSFTENRYIQDSLANITSNIEIFTQKVTSKHLTISKLLEKFGYENFRIPISFFMESLGALKPRYYSISSSSLESPGTTDITVSLDKNTNDDFEGVFSKELERILNDQTNALRNVKLPMFIETSKFRLSTNPGKPTILICAGVGIAPFRAFIRESALKNKSADIGKLFLYYGLRKQETDFLYSKEFNQLSNELQGKLEINIAESRGDKPKTYVQDLLKKHGCKIGELCINDNASIYVCGRASTMGKGVSKTLIDIFSERKGGIKQGDNYLKFMKILGRYREDIW